jgi:hypothetical protein
MTDSNYEISLSLLGLRNMIFPCVDPVIKVRLTSNMEDEKEIRIKREWAEKLDSGSEI